MGGRIAHHCAMATVVLRQPASARRRRSRVLTYALERADPFARSLEAALRRQLPPDWTLQPESTTPLVTCARTATGAWEVTAGTAVLAVDELACGALAARHLIALGLRTLAYVSSVDDDLRRRGFSIAATALGAQVAPLNSGHLSETVGVFAAGALAETTALAALAATGRRIPRDALLLGLADGSLPLPEAPQLARLQLDADHVAQAIFAALTAGTVGRVLLVPTGVVTRGPTDNDTSEPHLLAALAWIDQHLHLAIGVDGVARAAGLPRRTCERLFQRTRGRSPLAEISQRRVERAQELLTGSDLTLADIAKRCGFSGTDRLGVVFRQLTGSTPAAWRTPRAVRPNT